MDTTIHLVTNRLYREPLKEKLRKAGFATEIFKMRKCSKGLPQIANQLFIVQAHMWPNVNHTLSATTSVVMFGTPSWFYCWFKAVLNHSSAYLTPFDSLDVITLSLRQVLQGNHYLSKSMAELLLKDRKERQKLLLDVNLSSHLTSSELEVLVLVGERYTTSEIAKKRFRSIHTVKTQRKKIRRKMDTINRERLAVFAGRKVYALKTLLLIEKNTEMLYRICKNTS